MHGKYNFANLINDLATLDPELFKNLMFIKNYSGDLSELALSFTVTDDSLGKIKETELIAGGSAMEVNTGNRHRYINLVAKYYLHDRIKGQARAFFG